MNTLRPDIKYSLSCKTSDLQEVLKFLGVAVPKNKKGKLYNCEITVKTNEVNFVVIGATKTIYCNATGPVKVSLPFWYFNVNANCSRNLKRCARLKKKVVCSYLKVNRFSTDRKLFEKFLKVVLGFLGLTGFRFSGEFCCLTQNPLRLWAVIHFHHLTRNRILKI
jgi:hypothetical protein